MTRKRDRRAFRFIVLGSRLVGRMLIALAFANLLQTGVLGSLPLISSVALGLVGGAWIIGLELFLTFFDNFLSRN
jgi:hypothetical protein